MDLESWHVWFRRRGGRELRELVMREWNPIGHVPDDEYDGYLGRIADLLRRGGSIEEVTVLLEGFRTRNMGLRPLPARDRHAATELVRWYAEAIAVGLADLVTPGDVEPGAADFISARFAPESDGTGELHVMAVSGSFAGRSSAWFNANDVAKFAAQLAAYPLPDDAPVVLSSGYMANATTGEPAQEHVGIMVSPRGRLGQIVVAVHLATAHWAGSPGKPNEVRLELLTTYERLRRFSIDLQQVVQGQQRTARLEAEGLA